jgi:hypothetical protein
MRGLDDCVITRLKTKFKVQSSATIAIFNTCLLLVPLINCTIYLSNTLGHNAASRLLEGRHVQLCVGAFASGALRVTPDDACTRRTSPVRSSASAHAGCRACGAAENDNVGPAFG